MKVYISGALNGVPAECRERYEQFAELLTEYGVEAYVPHLHTDQTAEALGIYHQGLKGIRGADAVVAFLDEPGLGTGAEIAISVYMEKPLVAIRQQGRTVSRFILGLLLEAGRENVKCPVVILEYDQSALRNVAQQVAHFLSLHI